MAGSSKLIAITGGTGFVGAYVIRELLAEGYHVRAMVRTPSKADIQHDNLEWFKGSLGDLSEAFVKDADAVIHIAGLIKARRKVDYMQVNADYAGAIAAMAEAAGVKQFVLLSSQAAEQPHLSDYAVSKHAGEGAVQAAFTGRLSVVRAPAVFGSGDKATAPFFEFIRRGKLPVPGGKGWKNRKISMVYAPDLARFIVSLLKKNGSSEILTPASLPNMTWPEFADLMSDVRGALVKPVPVPLSLLYPVAQVTSVTSRLFGLGHLTRGKLREFLHADWSSEELIPDATPPIDALAETLRSYEPK